MKERILSCLIGYIFGCFLSSVFIAGKLTGRDPYDYGSGNPGMANVMAHEGRSIGLAVLLGDLLKTGIACAVAMKLFKVDIGRISVLYAGFGTTLGHNFPFWHSFKGGKGVASTCTAIVLFSPLWGTVSCLAGAAAVLTTGYLALGGVLIPLIFIFPAFLVYGKEAGIIAVILFVIMCLRHKAGMLRVFRHEEKRVRLFKK